MVRDRAQRRSRRTVGQFNQLAKRHVTNPFPPVPILIDRGLLEEAIKTAPSTFTCHARNTNNHLQIGGNSIIFSMVASTPNASDMDSGRRPGNFRDYENFLRLSQSLNICHLNGGYPVEPVDVPPETRHLTCIQSFIKLTDKPFHAYSLGRQRIVDALEMTRIGRG